MPFPDFTPTVPELVRNAAARFGDRTYLVADGERVRDRSPFAAHGVDTSLGLTFAMDLTPLVVDTTKDIAGTYAAIMAVVTLDAIYIAVSSTKCRSEDTGRRGRAAS